MRTGLICSVTMLFTAAAIAMQAGPPGGGGSQSSGSGGEVTSISMGYTAAGNGIYMLEAEADYEAWVDESENCAWDFRYSLTIHDEDSYEWARNTGAFTLSAGNSASWSSDTFNGPSTSVSGVYNAGASIEGRCTGVGEFASLDFDSASVTIP